MAQLLQRICLRTAKTLRSEARDETQWHVGGRYELLQPLALFKRPDLASESCGMLLPREKVLLLALAVAPKLYQAGEVLLAFLASTDQTAWVHGWAQLEAAGASTLRRQRLKGSWEVGGRYLVLGNPVLRAGIELESEPLCEILRGEEVLVLELGLVLRDEEPRLRAYVRADAGQLGWLTVELPGGRPLLEPVNLYSEDAVSTNACSCCWRRPQPAARRCSGRVSVSGVSEGDAEAWEVGGKYRLLAKAALHEDAELDSRVISALGAGTLVFIEELRHVSAKPGCDGPLRFRVFAEGLGSHGWISSMGSSGEALVDVRDHLEYEKLMRNCLSDISQMEPTSQFTIRLNRHGDVALGVHVDHSDGKTLVVKAITSGGLFEAWNSANPDRGIQVGDRILTVNGFGGDALTLVDKLSRESELDLLLQAERGPPRGAGAETNQLGLTPYIGGCNEALKPDQLEALEPVHDPEADQYETPGTAPEPDRRVTPEPTLSPEPDRPHEEPPPLPSPAASWGFRAFDPAEPASVGGVPSSPRSPTPSKLEACSAGAPPSSGASTTGGSVTMPARALLSRTSYHGPNQRLSAVAGTPATGSSCEGGGGSVGGASVLGHDDMGTLAACASASDIAADVVIPTVCRNGAVRLYVTEDGPDWRPVEVGGAADGEEPPQVCPCRDDRAWMLSGFTALLGCGGDSHKRLLVSLGGASAGRGHGSTVEAAPERQHAQQLALSWRSTM